MKMRFNAWFFLVIAYEVKTSFCAKKDGNCVADDAIKDVVVKRVLAKQGFHRDMTATLEWTSMHINCTIVLQESLPRGVYVDLDQVNMMTHQLAYKIRSNSRVDVEEPAHKSKPQTLWVYLLYSQLKTKRNSHHKVSITVPVHLRYHRPSATGKTHETVSLQSPRVLAKCDGMTVNKDCKVVQLPCSDTGYLTCDWIELSSRCSDVVSIEVPVGPQHHSVAVTMITLLCTVTGTAWTLSQIMH